MRSIVDFDSFPNLERDPVVIFYNHTFGSYINKYEKKIRQFDHAISNSFTSIIDNFYKNNNTNNKTTHPDLQRNFEILKDFLKEMLLYLDKAISLMNIVPKNVNRIKPDGKERLKLLNTYVIEPSIKKAKKIKMSLKQIYDISETLLSNNFEDFSKSDFIYYYKTFDDSTGAVLDGYNDSSIDIFSLKKSIGTYLAYIYDEDKLLEELENSVDISDLDEETKAISPFHKM
jgi:hypothetical protein